MMEMMADGIQKIRVEEMNTVRLVFDVGYVHEIAVSSLAKYAATSVTDNDVKNHLSMLAQCFSFFSNRGTKPSIEFVLPVKR
jgi:hypothetical protein